MLRATGATLLQMVAQRILVAYMSKLGYADVRSIGGAGSGSASGGVDLLYSSGGRRMKVKVKPDSYFGTDPAKVHDRELTFYRPDAGHYAFESISNNMTREPGWMFNSDADELFYYYLALTQSEEEIGALVGEPDEVFLSEIKVERDELRILPMKATRAWFESHYEAYTPRPVTVGDHSAWFRLIPRSDIDGALAGIRTTSAVFETLSR